MHTPLPEKWIKSLFARLQVRYGSAWLNKWKGVDLSDVQADWADVLGGYGQAPDAIAHALNNLPADMPPTVSQFAALCRNAPRYAPKALAAPVANPAIVAAVKEAFKPKAGIVAKEWAHTLRKREQQAGRLTVAQRAMWRAALESEAGAAA
jgi:hypothetical protein